MSGRCKDCRHYEPFSVYWESEKWYWTHEQSEEAQRQALRDFAQDWHEGHTETHWKTRRWGRCLLARTEDTSLVHPESLAGAVDKDEYEADLRCSPDYGCVMFEAREVFDRSDEEGESDG